MKKLVLLTGLLVSAYFIQAQNADYKVVFDLTSKDNPAAKLEVVVYGQGLDLLIKGRTAQEPLVSQLAMDKDITFKACAVALKRNNIDPSQLIAGVQTVPDGIYEIISKQREGWGYIKVAH